MAGGDLTPKQERFAQVYVETSNASEAYRQVYDVSPEMSANAIWVEAHRLAANPKVALRVAELQAEAAERHRVTVDSITREYEEARSLALREGQAAAAVSASTGKAKLHGLLTDKMDVKHTINHEDWLERVIE